MREHNRYVTRHKKNCAFYTRYKLCKVIQLESHNKAVNSAIQNKLLILNANKCINHSIRKRIRRIYLIITCAINFINVSFMENLVFLKLINQHLTHLTLIKIIS